VIEDKVMMLWSMRSMIEALYLNNVDKLKFVCNKLL